jgi:excisionase family DNA binding protein
MNNTQALGSLKGSASASAISASCPLEQNLTSEQTAKLLGLSEPTLQRMRTDGSGPPFVKLGRRVLYSPARLMEWLAQRTVTSTADARERHRTIAT